MCSPSRYSAERAGSDRAALAGLAAGCSGGSRDSSCTHWSWAEGRDRLDLVDPHQRCARGEASPCWGGEAATSRVSRGWAAGERRVGNPA